MLLRALAVLILAALPLSAQERVALVMGADAYQTIRPLDNARSDAAAIANALGDLGFEVTLATDRDLKGMRRALSGFVAANEGAEVAVVFWAGHGIEVRGDNRLLPVDADPTSVETLVASSLPLDEVRAAAARVAPVVLILVDACREDPFGAAAGDAGRSARPLAAPVAAEVSPGMGRMGDATDTLFAFAAAPGATASDGSGPNSPFTTALARYLGTEGLEIRSVLTLVQQDVYDATRGKQLPYVENGLPKLFFAAERGGTLPERDRLLLAMADLSEGLRAEVEAIAARQDVPLAPLYGAVLAAGLADLPEAERAVELKNAATAYAETLGRLRRLSAADPEVERLRGEAEAALELGAFDTARTALDKAIAFDIGSIDDLKTSLERRILSAVASLYAKAGVAQTALDTPGAIAALEQAMELLGQVEVEKLAFDDWVLFEKCIGDLARLKELSGDTQGAATLLREYRARSERRHELDGSVDSLRSISVALDRLGGVLLAQGDAAGATEAYERGLDIARELFDSAPDEPLYRRDMVIGLVKIGDLRRRAGDTDGAEAAFAEAVERSAALAAEHPENLDWRRDEVSTRTRLGDVMLDRGRVDEAEAGYIRARDIAADLAAANPQATEVLRDLALSWGKLADIAYTRQDFDGQEAAAREGLRIAEDLASRDPTNTQWQRDLATILSKLGDAISGHQDWLGGAEAYRRSLDIQRRIAQQDPANLSWQADLALILTRLGEVEGLAQVPGGADHLTEAIDILRPLAAEQNTPELRRMLVLALMKATFLRPDPLDLLAEAKAVLDVMTRDGQIGAQETRLIAFLGELQTLFSGRTPAPPEGATPSPRAGAGPSNGPTPDRAATPAPPPRVQAAPEVGSGQGTDQQRRRPRR